MHIDSIKHKIKIVGLAEAVCLSPGELAGWNILSIRGRNNEATLNFPGAWSAKTLYFDDVEKDYPKDQLFAARPEDIQAALEFSRGINDEPLLIHCAAGVSRSTAIAWIIIYDKIKANAATDAVRQSFDIVRKLRPILDPNRHVLRLGIEALVPIGNRKAITQQFQDCLGELDQSNSQAG